MKARVGSHDYFEEAPTGRRDLKLNTRCVTAELFSPGRLGALTFDADRGWDLRDPVVEAETVQEIEDQSPFLTIATPGHCELLPAVRSGLCWCAVPV